MCQRILGPGIDAAVGALLVASVTPVALEPTLAVQPETRARLAEADRLRHRQVERAQYEQVAAVSSGLGERLLRAHGRVGRARGPRVHPHPGGGGEATGTASARVRMPSTWVRIPGFPGPDSTPPRIVHRAALANVVRRNYIVVVLKTVGIRDLKIHLSAHLRDVARGDLILVTDRGRVVAELRPPGAVERAMTPEEHARQRLIAAGRLRPAVAPAPPTWPSPLPRLLKRGTAQALLDAERAERP
jgi:antitoxin (DNA-binding transcriptional repressor) of toxin-antitoxin stability system